MAKNKITKEDLKSPDAFLTFADKVGETLSANWRPLAALVGVLIVIGLGYTVATELNRANEEEASGAMFEVENKLTLTKMDHAKKRQTAVQDMVGDDGKQNQAKIDAKLAEIPELEFEKDFAENAKALEQVINEYSSTEAAQMYRIRLARLYIDYDKIENAETLLRQAVENSSKGTAIYGLSRTLLASVLSQKGNADESIQLLSEVAEDPKLTYLRSEALLKLGVLSQQNGDTNRAEEMYRKVSTEFGDTEAGKMAKNLLKLINFVGTQQKEAVNKASGIDI